MSILERINSSNDIKKLPEEELEPLCQELRDYMISSISRTGGHLASNLGAVELTVALHRVYDTSRDRVVYVHKIITGRRDSFCTLRQHGGLSGFPKPYESEDDAFIAGHASNSVSVALGMARARTLSHADYDVAAIIGDGALSGGLAYEGLANAAASGEPLVVILNDNNMSINENVGGTAHLLESLRVRPGYISFKRWYRDVFTKLPGLYKFNHAIKEWLKKRLLPGNVFSGMGMYLAFASALLVAFALIHARREPDADTLLLAALLLAAGLPLILPQMNARCLYLAGMLAFACVNGTRRLAIAIVLELISLCSYMEAIFSFTVIPMNVLSLLAIACATALALELMGKLGIKGAQIGESDA